MTENCFSNFVTKQEVYRARSSENMWGVCVCICVFCYINLFGRIIKGANKLFNTIKLFKKKCIGNNNSEEFGDFHGKKPVIS